MIILYGSYARNTYVELDIQRDFGGGEIQFMSDYDILVVTKRRLGSKESIGGQSHQRPLFTV